MKKESHFASSPVAIASKLLYESGKPLLDIRISITCTNETAIVFYKMTYMFWNACCMFQSSYSYMYIKKTLYCTQDTITNVQTYAQCTVHVYSRNSLSLPPMVFIQKKIVSLLNNYHNTANTKPALIDEYYRSNSFITYILYTSK